MVPIPSQMNPVHPHLLTQFPQDPFILLLPFHLSLGLPSGLFLQVFRPKFCMTFSFYHACYTSPSISSFMIRSPRSYMMKHTSWRRSVRIDYEWCTESTVAGAAQLVYWLGYGLDDRGSIPSRCNNGIFFFSPPRPDRLMGIGGSFPGVNWPGLEAERSPPSSAVVKNAWNYTPTPPYVFTAWCLIKQWVRLHGMMLT
jgi:hypothetical protein